MGSNSSAKKESRRCMRCFSPLELMGIVPGSTTTTIPVTTCREADGKGDGKVWCSPDAPQVGYW